MNAQTPPETLILPRNLVQDLFHQAQLAPEREICGLIGGVNGEARRCYPVANVAGEPADRFDMDQPGQIEAMRRMRERGETLFAIYHSHPHAPPEPSPRDRERLGHPGVWQLIISLNIKGVLELRAWRMAGQALREFPLKIIRG